MNCVLSKLVLVLLEIAKQGKTITVFEIILQFVVHFCFVWSKLDVQLHDFAQDSRVEEDHKEELAT